MERVGTACKGAVSRLPSLDVAEARDLRLRTGCRTLRAPIDARPLSCDGTHNDLALPIYGHVHTVGMPCLGESFSLPAPLVSRHRAKQRHTEKGGNNA